MLPWLRNVRESAQKAPWPAVDHALQTGIVAVMAVAAVALLVTHQAPAPVGHTHKPAHVAAAGSVGSNLLQKREAVPAAPVDPISVSSKRRAPGLP